MKLLQKILLVVGCIALSIASTGTAYSMVNQIQIFNNFADESWKSKQITVEWQKGTIEQHLVNAFNTNRWIRRTNATKISANLNADIESYYNGTLKDPENIPNNYLPANPVDWDTCRNNYSIDNLALNDSPRQWLKKLDLREIYRFKKYIEDLRDLPVNPVNLINNINYATDDLVKARALCGIFVVHYGTEVCGHFSGMLVPGQAFDNATYSVHTCMHGFGQGNSSNGTNINITYYFVPYGVTVHDSSEDPTNNAAQKGFKVTSIRQGGQQNAISFNTLVSATAPATLYRQNDYAIVTIESTNAGGESLYDILRSVDNANPIGAAIVHGEGNNNQITNLPNINEVGDLQIDTVSNFNPAEEKLFIIGRTPNVSCALDNFGLAICIMLKNEALTHNENRSSENNENIKNPANKVNIGTLNESFSSLPSYPGISGGVILRCKMSSLDGSKKCAFIGTNWGSERIFNDYQLKGLGHFINNP